MDFLASSRRISALVALLVVGAAAPAFAVPISAWHVVSIDVEAQAGEHLCTQSNGSLGPGCGQTGGNGDRVSNQATGSVSGSSTNGPYVGVGGAAFGAADLADGTLKVKATAVPSNNGLAGGAAFASAELGSRIFLHGPSNLGGIVSITTYVNGGFTDPDTIDINRGQNTYGSGTRIYVQTGESNDGLGFTGNSPGDMIFIANDGIVDELSCVSCVVSGNNPLPTAVTTNIAFNPGQQYVDFFASLYAL